MKFRGFLSIVLLTLLLGCLGSGPEIANWPNGKRAALVVTIDGEGPVSGDLGQTIDLLERFDVNATFFIVPGYYEGAEDELELVKNYEVASKGWNQSEWTGSKEARSESIQRAHEKLVSLGFSPRGFRAPFLKSDERTIQLLREKGYKYDSSSLGLLPQVQEGFVILPLSVSYDPFWDDSVKENLPLFYSAFETTIEKKGLFQFYTLPRGADQDLENFLNYALSKDIWITTSGEAADWWLKRSMVVMSQEGDEVLIRNTGKDKVEDLALVVDGQVIEVPPLASGEEWSFKT